MCATHGRSHLNQPTPFFIASPTLGQRRPNSLSRALAVSSQTVRVNHAHVFYGGGNDVITCSKQLNLCHHVIRRHNNNAVTNKKKKLMMISPSSKHSQACLVSIPIHLLRTCHTFVKWSLHGASSVATAAAVVFTIFTCSVNAATTTTVTPGRISKLAAEASAHNSNTAIVIFDRDFEASWQDGTAAPLSLSPQPAELQNQRPSKTSQSPTLTPPSPPQHVIHSQPSLGGLPSPSLALEARILSRLLVALVVGGVIGMERRAANSLAGVRTFSLVSLGAAIFMSTTLTAFPTADPTRVAAAISSSVGFLGAGAMHKNSKHSRGLTTASSVWLAAALGIAAASGLFLLSFSGAIATVIIARYARFDSSLHLIRGDPTQNDDLDELHDDTHDVASASGAATAAASVNVHGGNGLVIGKADGHRWDDRRSLDGMHLDEDEDNGADSSGNGSTI